MIIHNSPLPHDQHQYPQRDGQAKLASVVRFMLDIIANVLSILLLTVSNVEPKCSSPRSLRVNEPTKYSKSVHSGQHTRRLTDMKQVTCKLMKWLTDHQLDINLTGRQRSVK